MVEEARFVRIAVRCHCPKPKFFAVDVARSALAGLAGETPDLDAIVLSFRCRGCGVNPVPWSVIVRAARPRPPATPPPPRPRLDFSP